MNGSKSELESLIDENAADLITYFCMKIFFNEDSEVGKTQQMQEPSF